MFNKADLFAKLPGNPTAVRSSVHLFTHPLVRPSVSVWPSVRLSIHQSISLYLNLSAHMSVSPSVYLSLSEIVRLYVLQMAFLTWCRKQSWLQTFSFAGVFGRFGLAVFTVFACSGLVLHLLVLQILRSLPPHLRDQDGTLSNTHLTV